MAKTLQTSCVKVAVKDYLSTMHAQGAIFDDASCAPSKFCDCGFAEHLFCELYHFPEIFVHQIQPFLQGGLQTQRLCQKCSKEDNSAQVAQRTKCKFHI